MDYFLLLPVWYQTTVVVVFGLIIGSFLNVIIYRLHTGRSLNGSSHCLSCGTRLRWFELFPVVSYITLRGRCRTCGSYIPFRYVTVELTTALFFLTLFHLVPLGPGLLLWWLLGSLLLVIVTYDLYHLIIPDELTVAVGVVVIALWWLNNQQVPLTGILQTACAGAFVSFLVYGGLWKVSAGRWIGFGDAKLSLPLGFFLGVSHVFSFIVLSFWVGAGLSVLLLGVQRLLKRGQRHLSFIAVPITMKSEVPFAPFLIISFLLVALWQVDVLELINRFLSL